MIFDELNTSLVFYDDIDKQNRYRSNCASICEYRQLCPINTILPFQIRTEYDDSTVVLHFYVRCESDGTAITDLIDTSNVEVSNILNVGTYLTFNGTLVKDEIPCGNYYIEVVIQNEAGEFSYFSEVFTMTSEVEDPIFEQSIFPVYSVWAWYDDINKRSENNEPCLSVCPYHILCGNDALIPFQYRVESAASLDTWILTNGECIVVLDVEMLTIQTVGDYTNVIYDGALIDLPCGLFYSELVIDGVTHYSEGILITNDFETASSNYILQETGDKLLQEDSFGILY